MPKLDPYSVYLKTLEQFRRRSETAKKSGKAPWFDPYTICYETLLFVRKLEPSNFYIKTFGRLRRGFPSKREVGVKRAARNRLLVSQSLFELSEEFKEKCNYLDKHATELFNLRKDLVFMQLQIREQFEKAEKERNRAIENYERLMTRILSVLDDFSSEIMENHSVKSTRTIINFIKEALLETVRREGVEVMQIARGEAFDPRLCVPVRIEFSDELPEGTILKVENPGYMLFSKVLRKARVIISTKEKVTK